MGEEEAKDKFLVQTASLTGDFYEEHLQDRDTKLSSLSLSPEDSKTIKEEQTKIVSEMWSQRPKTEIESKRLTTKFVYGSLPDSYSPSPIAPSVDPNMNAPSAPVPGSPEGLFTELSALRKKYDDLVAYSVDVTADRDRLNGMVQKLKADVKRSEGVTRTVLAPEGAAE